MGVGKGRKRLKSKAIPQTSIIGNILDFHKHCRRRQDVASAHQRPEVFILPSSHVMIGVIKIPFT